MAIFGKDNLLQEILSFSMASAPPSAEKTREVRQMVSVAQLNKFVEVLSSALSPITAVPKEQKE